MRVDLTDFSGGILEAVSPADFSKRQNAVLRGFVIEDEVRLRSQGPIQRISGDTAVRYVRPFRGASTAYLVTLRTDGSIGWAVAPSRTATNSTTSAVSFTYFAGLTFTTNYRFMCETRWKVGSEYVPALLIHSLAGTAPAVVVYENSSTTLTYATVTDFYPGLSTRVEQVLVNEGGTGYTSAPTVTISAPAAGGVQATATAIVRAGSVVAVEVTEQGRGYTGTPTVSFSGGAGSGATALAITGQVAESGTMPRANVAATWAGALVLADIEWSADNATSLTSANVKRYSNFAWIATDGSDITKFDPRYPYRLAEEGTTIVGLQEVNEGLLVITTSSTNAGGLVLLRGGPTNYTPEVLRPGLGMLPGTDAAVRTQSQAWWNEIASTVFIDSLGKVFQVRGTQVDRIDRYGVTAPETATVNDHVAAVGGWLFCYRAGRLLMLRSFGGDGAWSEMVTPAGTVRSLVALDDTVLFTAGDRLYRYCIEGPAAERGMVEGAYVDLTFGTRTFGNPDETVEKWWEGLTVRAQGVTSAVLKSVVLYAGAVLETPAPPAATFTLNETIGPRELVSVPGLGPSVECSALLTFTGDVRVENLSFRYSQGDEEL